MEKYLVSIVIPIYNGEKYIDKCLLSIINQTYKNYEIILIDDESNDDSLKIMTKYSKKYSFVKIFKQKNTGQAIARNRGIEYSNGDYIMFIDQDDYIDVDYIEKFVNYISKNDYDMVVGGYRRINQDKKILFSVVNNKDNNDWYKYTVMAPWAKIYKRSVFIDFDAKFLDYNIGEDVYFSLGLYSKNLKVGNLNYIGYNWYYNDSSISNTLHKGLQDSVDLVYLLDELIKFNTVNNAEVDYFNYFIFRFCIYYLLTSGRYSNSLDFKKEYLKLKKWIIKNDIVNVKIPKMEKLKIKLCIVFFKFMFNKIKLLDLFCKIYCKG